MPPNKPTFYLVLLGAPLLMAVVVFLGSLYFVNVEVGINPNSCGMNQRASSSIPARKSPLVIQRVSTPAYVTESMEPADTEEIKAEAVQESPDAEARSLLEPPFYKPSNEELAKLSREQLVIYNGIMEDYLKFYAEWSKNTPDDLEAWNRKVQEYNQEIRFMLGREAYNMINFR
jgi:hypothetical protein